MSCISALVLVFFLSDHLPASNPDDVYPIPNNHTTESEYGINLFTGDLNKTIPLLTIAGKGTTYALNAFYNSRTPALVTGGVVPNAENALGGMGWKLMDYPKIVQDGAAYYLLDGHAAHKLQTIAESKYTPGGKYYLWQVTKNADDSWRIATEDGTRFTFTGPPTTAGDHRKVWHVSTKAAPIWGDEITFSYTADCLSRIADSKGTSYTLTYAGKRLRQIAQEKDDHLIRTILLSYKDVACADGQTHSQLAEIKHEYRIAEGVVSEHQAATGFDYLGYQSAPTPGGDNYPGAMYQITLPAGATVSYRYQKVPFPGGVSAPCYNLVQHAVNNGYDNHSGGVFDPYTYTRLSYEPSNAAVGADGVYLFYNAVVVAPGVKYDNQAQGGAHPFGNLEHYFLNGAVNERLLKLPGGYRGVDLTSPVLMGLGYRTIINGAADGVHPTDNKVDDQYFWGVAFLSGDNVGAFAKLIAMDEKQHGIGKKTYYEYGTEYQLPVAIHTTRINPKPDKESDREGIRTEIRYAFEQYPALKGDDLHVINVPGMTTTRVQEAGTQNSVVTSCNCTQWTQWDADGKPLAPSGTWATYRTLHMRSGEADPKQCFDAAGTDSHWLVQNTVNRRSGDGLPTEEANALGAPTAHLRSSRETGGRIIATYVNARAGNPGNAGYWGFEPYETNPVSNWRGADETKIVAVDAHTGNRAFTDGELSNKFLIESHRDYTFSLWRRGRGAVTLALKDGGNQTITSKTFQSNDREWTFYQVTASLKAKQTVLAELSVSADAFVDDLLFMPVGATVEINVYDMQRGNITARMGLNGDTTYQVFNRFDSLVATVGPGSMQRIKEISIPYHSRRGNKFMNGSQDFDPEFPNMHLNVQARQGGSWEGFQHENTGNFPASDRTGMQIQDGWLAAAIAPASAQFSNSGKSPHYALYTEVFPNQLGEGQEIGISARLQELNPDGTAAGHSRLKFVLTPTEAKLYDEKAVYETKPIHELPNSTSLFLEVVAHKTLYAYANGRYLFHHDFPMAKISGPIKLMTNHVGAAFDNFLYVEKPRVTQTTFDGLNRPKQHMTRKDADALHISETLYGGPLDLPVAQTRAATIGGDDFADRAFSYKPNFARGFDYDKMTIDDSSTLGDAADYANPFSGSVRYDPSPLLQIAAVGGGGDFTAGETGGHDTAFKYRMNAGTLFPFRKGDFSVSEKTNPDKSTDYTYHNRDKIVFAKARVKTDSTGTATIKTQYFYDKSMRLQKIHHPNYFDASVEGREGFVSTYQYDFSGNRISIQEPDSGLQELVYDPAGRLRFKLDANGRAASPNIITYIKYDNLNRIVEQGMLKQAWHREQFQKYADTAPFWPMHTDSRRTPKKIFHYDGRGVFPFQGRLTYVQTFSDEDEHPDVYETYQYDVYGNVVDKSLSIRGFKAMAKHHTVYTYDMQNRVTGIQFPGTGNPGVVYGYDGQGRVISIGTPDNPYFYAAYDYDYQTSEKLNNRSFLRTYQYNHAGWPVRIDDPLFQEELSYRHKAGGGIYYNGNVAELRDSYKRPGPDFTRNSSYTYDLDGRLSTAFYTPGHPWNIGANVPTRYDSNGNILELDVFAAEPRAFKFQPGTNRQISSTGGWKINYDPNGAVTFMYLVDFQYDKVTGMTTSINMKDTVIALQYDGKNQRVFRTLTTPEGLTTKRMYVHGMNDYPLMEVSQDASGAEAVTFYVYGPTGLVAIRQGNETYFVLKDHLGSVRQVIDSNNQEMASFEYSTYGAITSYRIDDSIAHIPLHYRFTGQEQELGLLWDYFYNYRARIYDVNRGRFLSPDPLMQYASPYEYAGNNPINYVDPSGQWGFWSIVGTIAAVVAVAAIGVAASPAAAVAVAQALTMAGGGVVTTAAVTTGASYTAVAGGAVFAVAIKAERGDALPGGPDGIMVISQPPLNAKDDGIGEPKRVHAVDFGVTNREVQGWYAEVDLAKVEVVVPNNDSNKDVGCPIDPAFPKLRFPYRVIANAESGASQIENCGCDAADQTTTNQKTWQDYYQSTLWINANFFATKVDRESHPYHSKCTNIQGVSFSNGTLLSDWPEASDLASDMGGAYQLDALVFFKPGAPQANGRRAQMITHDNLSLEFLNDNAQNAVGGMYILRGGDDKVDFHGVAYYLSTRARTAVGLSEDGGKLLVLVVDDRIPKSEGVSFPELVTFFRSKGYLDVFNLDGAGSSAFLYTKDGKIFKSCPMDESPRLHRPVPNFLGFK